MSWNFFPELSGRVKGTFLNFFPELSAARVKGMPWMSSQKLSVRIKSMTGNFFPENFLSTGYDFESYLWDHSSEY